MRIERCSCLSQEATPFVLRDHDRTHRLMRVVDRINHDMGRGAIRIASAAPFELTPGRTVAWKGRCENRSPRYATRWGEFPAVRAVCE